MRRNLLLAGALVGLVVTLTAFSHAGETILVPNRLALAKVGEWATYRIPDGFIQKHTVVERVGEGRKAQLKIRVDSILDGEVVDSTEMV